MSNYVATGASRRSVVVDVYLLFASDARILLSKRANTGYGDGAYEPPSGQLAGRETIVETAIRIAAAVGLRIEARNVSLAHVMHDVSGGGRIAFFLAVSGWEAAPPAGAPPAGAPAAAAAPAAAGTELRWFPLAELPTNMLDRARVALRNYAEGVRFSTYPAFAHLASLRAAPAARASAARAPAARAVSAGAVDAGGCPVRWASCCRYAGLPDGRDSQGARLTQRHFPHGTDATGLPYRR